MSVKKKKVSPASIIVMIMGIAIIVFGLTFPRMEKGNLSNTFKMTTELSGFERKLEFELETIEKLDTNSVYAIINKVGEVDEERVHLKLKATPTGDKGYIFVATLDVSEFGLVDQDDVVIEARNHDYTTISFQPRDEFGSGMHSSFRTFAKIACIMIGAFLVIIGLVLSFASNKAKEVKASIVGTVNPSGETEGVGIIEAVGNRIKDAKTVKMKHCVYCGSDNKIEKTKCESCGAPLKNS